MSKISQELKVLLYLNDKYRRTRWVTIKEIAEYLEISDRQARRYLEDLNMIPEIDIETKLGRDGGYRLRTKLDEGFAIPENIVLAISIAMKRNDRIEKILMDLPNYVVTDSIVGDNEITNTVLDNLEVLVKSIKNQKEVNFNYKDFDNKLYIQPYKIVFTNKTYYLYGVYKEQLKKYNVSKITNIGVLGAFKPDRNIVESIENKTKRYGIIDDTESVLKVKCSNIETMEQFDKFFEGKGTKDFDELTYTVIGNSEHELFYPLFRIGVLKYPYKFMDLELKKRYIKYLKDQIKALEDE